MDQATFAALKAKRAAALLREVNVLARTGQPAPPAGLPAALQGRGGGSNLGALGPMRGHERPRPNKPYAPAQELLRQRNSKPPAPPSLPPARNQIERPVSRTASTVSHCSDLGSCREEEGELGLTPDEVGLTGLSPLSSPYLASCVSLLGTPELLGIMPDRKQTSSPPPIALPDQFESAAKPRAPELPSADDDELSWMRRSALDQPSAPCPSPTPNANPAGWDSLSSPTPEQKPLHRHAGSKLGSAGLGAAANVPLDRPASFTCLDMLCRQ